MDRIVCDCLGITAEDIKEAVKNGSKTLDDIKDATDAGTICGCCEAELETTLHEFL